MNDHRVPLGENTPLLLGGIEYTVSNVVGRGSNAIVYKAFYKDGLLEEKNHTVLIKELFPLHNDGLIYRDGLNIVVAEKAESFFQLHKKSFLRGNSAHIDIQEIRADKSPPNINSDVLNGTLYSVLGLSNGITMAESAASGELSSLADAVDSILNILDSLKVFHHNNMLHLDISPDNILFLPKDKGPKERLRNVLLIDYNSVFSLEELTDSKGLYYSVKAGYSAPEIRLKDCTSIGPQTDLFSVCAIFLELLRREPLSIEELTENTIKIGTLEDCPVTAVHKIKAIIWKGLRPSPKQRYQSIEEMAADFEELVNRLEGVGVTHSALWEASAHGFAAFCKNPSYDYLKNALIPMEIEIHGEKTIVTGRGGLGKTTALLNMWKEGVDFYAPNKSVPVYIPLYNYKTGHLPYIKGLILERLKFDKSVSTVNDALRALNNLLNCELKTKNKSQPSVLLLLDGLNEVSGHMESLLKEIEELSSHKGVGIVMTTRGKRSLPGFVNVELASLTESQVKTYLCREKVLYPDEGGLPELLKNPMILSLYAKICQSKPGGIDIGAVTKDSIMEAYLESLLTNYKEKLYGDENQSFPAEFAIQILLPYLAAVMDKKRKQALTPDETYLAVENCYNDLKVKGFEREFPKYMGKVAVILNGAQTAGDWFDQTIFVLLKNKFALLWQDEEGNYRFPHENFIGYLSAIHKENDKKLHKIKRKKVLFYGIIVASLGTILALPVSRIIIPKEKTFPMAGTEENAVNMAMSSLAYSTTMVDLQLNCENKVLNSITDDTFVEVKAYQDFKEFMASQLRSVAAQSFNSEGADLSLNALSISRNPIPLDVLGQLYNMPKEHRPWLFGTLEALEEYISPDSLYTVEDKKQVVKLYQDWIENYTTMFAIKLKQALLPLPTEARNQALDKIVPNTTILKNRLLLINWGDTEYSGLESYEKTAFDIMLEFKGLGFTPGSSDNWQTEVYEEAFDEASPQEASVKPAVLEEVKEIFFDDMERILKWHNVCAGYYSLALDVSEHYLDEPTEENRKLASDLCHEASEGLIGLYVAVRMLDTAGLDALKDLNIDAADFMALFDTQSFYQNDYITSINNLLFYIDCAPALNEDFRQQVTRSQDIELLFRGINYIGVNHLLAEVEGDRLIAFRDEFLPTLKYFSRVDLPWEMDKGVLEVKSDALIVELERRIEEVAQHLGETYKKLLSEQEIYKQRLIDGGLTPEEAETRLKEFLE